MKPAPPVIKIRIFLPRNTFQDRSDSWGSELRNWNRALNSQIILITHDPFQFINRPAAKVALAAVVATYRWHKLNHEQLFSLSKGLWPESFMRRFLTAKRADLELPFGRPGSSYSFLFRCFVHNRSEETIDRNDDSIIRAIA